MLRLLLTVTVLTHGLILAASPQPHNCTDVVVRGRSSTKVKEFTSKKGSLLFFPDQGFEGVTISFTVAGIRTIAQRFTREYMCVNSSQWYNLDVTVDKSDNFRKCTFKTNYCDRECGQVLSNRYDYFNSLTVYANGASFWSLNNNQKTQCATPAAATPILTSHTPGYGTSGSAGPASLATASTSSGSAILPIVLSGVAGGAVVLAAVVIVGYLARRSLQFLCSRKRQQQLATINNSRRLQPFGHSNSGMEIHLEAMSTHHTEHSHSASSSHTAD